MNKKKLIKRGFTLVEMIVVIAILGIITIPIMQVMDTNGEVVKMSTDKVDAKSLALIIEDQLIQELRLANDIYIDTGTRPVVTTLSCIESPKFTVSGEPIGDQNVCVYDDITPTIPTKRKTIIAERMLDKFRVKLVFAQQANKVLGIDIKIMESPNRNNEFTREAYRLQTSVAPDNMKAGVIDAGVVTTGTGNKIYYTTP